MLSTARQTLNKSEPNKSLKFVPRFARHWTPSTGAASQLITGFGRHLAPRYKFINQQE
jgi:hypothetical protein